MTPEELAEVLKMVNASRPQITQTMNFNAPIGQQIAHVDKIEAHFDKNMGMQVANVGEINNASQQKQSNCEGLYADFPNSVKKIFRQPAFVERYVREMLRCYYKDYPKNLALIYCVLRDYEILTHEFEPREFILSLIDWRMLETMDEKTLKVKSDGMASYLKDRRIEGKIRFGLTPDFRNWTNDKDKRECEKIASVFGSEEGKTIHYKNYEKIHYTRTNADA